MEKEYIVTLKRREDLKSFYDDMETLGGSEFVPDRKVELKDRRAISRNTHYLLTEEEVEELKKDDRVLTIELTPEERGLIIKRFDSYAVSGNFDKTPDDPDDINWGILHCAGDESQRRKGVFGLGGTSQFTDTVTVFNDGENVDVVIVDEPVAYDHIEFLDPVTNESRFVQYLWYSELDQYMVDLPTQEDYTNFISSNPDLPYYNCSQLYGYSLSHGTHVAGTSVGKRQGWARKSNIYSITVNLGSVQDKLQSSEYMIDYKVFDYLRAFHKYKGTTNPTVTNHSWGYGYNTITLADLSNITSVYYRGSIYSEPEGGWTKSYLESNFGIYMTQSGSEYELDIPAKSASLDADVQDAIEDGVIVISAAGNDNYYCVPETHEDYNNYISISGQGAYYYNRGGSPGSSKDSITVGSISEYSDFRRASYSNYGPTINVFAPGSRIYSSIPYATNSFYGTMSGTSMATPQVTGIVACYCSGKTNVNNNSVLSFINEFGLKNEISVDLNSGGFGDYTTIKDSPNLTILAVDRRIEYKQNGVLFFNDTPRKNTNNDIKTGMVYPRKKIK